MYDPEDQNYEDVTMSIFSERHSPVFDAPITREPEANPTRRPIPVSTNEWQTSLTSVFSPIQGLDFIRDVNQLVIHQTVELADVMASMDSENRYIVKVPRGETIFYATESSTSFHRSCFGSSRAFKMRLYDPTQQEAVHFIRRLACGSCCSLIPYLQELEVAIPSGAYIGKVCQNFNLSRPTLSVFNHNDSVIYKIEGPDALIGCFLNKNHNFQIFSSDGSTQIGSIVHQWDPILVDYNLHLQMPGHENNTQYKALLIGAAFLLEYMYFESSRRRSMCKCVC